MPCGSARPELIIDPAAGRTARELAGGVELLFVLHLRFAEAGENLVMGVGVPPAFIEVLDAFAAALRPRYGLTGDRPAYQ